jgi:hypothetical protein
MSYKLTQSGTVLRLKDGASIPPNMDNIDWVEYQKWLALGNLPAPANPVVPPIPDPIDELRTALKADPTLLDKIKAMK